MVDSPSDPIVVLLVVKARPGCETLLRDGYVGQVTASRSDPGCIGYEVHQMVDDPATIIVYESWTTAAAHAAHLDTSSVKAFRAKAAGWIVGTFSEAVHPLMLLRPTP